jgi:hypothetical protein
MNKEPWISILDEEPAAGRGVLISFNTGVITIGYRVIKKNSHDWQLFGPVDFFGLTPIVYVTHWMPLPEPPNYINIQVIIIKKLYE